MSAYQWLVSALFIHDYHAVANVEAYFDTIDMD